VLLVVLLMVTGVKAGLLDSVAGGWSFGFTGVSLRVGVSCMLVVTIPVSP